MADWRVRILAEAFPQASCDTTTLAYPWTKRGAVRPATQTLAGIVRPLLLSKDGIPPDLEAPVALMGADALPRSFLATTSVEHTPSGVALVLTDRRTRRSVRALNWDAPEPDSWEVALSELTGTPLQLTSVPTVSNEDIDACVDAFARQMVIEDEPACSRHDAAFGLLASCRTIVAPNGKVNELRFSLPLRDTITRDTARLVAERYLRDEAYYAEGHDRKTLDRVSAVRRHLVGGEDLWQFDFFDQGTVDDSEAARIAIDYAFSSQLVCGPNVVPEVIVDASLICTDVVAAFDRLSDVLICGVCERKASVFFSEDATLPVACATPECAAVQAMRLQRDPDVPFTGVLSAIATGSASSFQAGACVALHQMATLWDWGSKPERASVAFLKMNHVVTFMKHTLDNFRRLVQGMGYDAMRDRVVP